MAPGAQIAQTTGTGTNNRVLAFSPAAFPQVLLAGRWRHRPGAIVPQHVHGSWVLDWMINGEIRWSRNGRSTLMRPGQAHLYAPGDTAGGQAGPSGGSFIGVIFRWPAFTEGAGRRLLPAVILPDPGRRAELDRLLHGIADSYAEGGPAWPLLGGARLAQVLGTLAGCAMEPLAGPVTPVDRAVAYLRRHPCERIRMQQVAAAAGLSLAHLRRSFVQRYGRPPLQYLIELRLEEMARQLGEARGQAVEAICHAAGFDDRRHASRLFRRRYGATPDRFRRGLPPQQRTFPR
jgi:AraC-like DNA-binding protein